MGLDLGTGIGLGVVSRGVVGRLYLDNLMREIARMLRAVTVSWRSPESGSCETMETISVCASTELAQESSCCIRSNM